MESKVKPISETMENVKEKGKVEKLNQKRDKWKSKTKGGKCQS